MGKTLILYVSAGAGHKQAALALKDAFLEQAPEETVLAEDILSFSSLPFRKIYTAGYLSLVKRAEHLWGYLYDLSDREQTRARQKIRSIFNAVNLFKFRKRLVEMDPDRIICTHYLPLERSLTLRRSEGLRAVIACSVTDYCVHALWINRDTDRYFVASDEAKRELLYSGIPERRVTVSGIPVSPRFSQPGRPDELKKKLKMAGDLPVVLCLSGGFGVGPIEQVLDSFSRGRAPVQVIVVCGRNEKLQQKLSRSLRRWQFPLRIVGFVDNMHDFCDLARVIVSKPGGLTVSEIMAKQVPFVIVNPIPGQEERNSDFLIEKGIAVKAHSPRDVAFRVMEILGSSRAYRHMQAMARRHGRPHAAEDIVRHVLSLKAENIK